MSDYTSDQMATAIADGSSRDTIIITMVSTHEYSLNSATKRYAELAKELEIPTGKQSRREDVMAAIPEDISLINASAEELSTMADQFAEQFGIKAKTVHSYFKSVYEEAGAAYPQVGSESEAILDWLTANDECEKEEFETFMRTAGKNGSPRSASNVNEYWKGMTLHRRIMAKMASMEE